MCLRFGLSTHWHCCKCDVSVSKLFSCDVFDYLPGLKSAYTSAQHTCRLVVVLAAAKAPKCCAVHPSCAESAQAHSSRQVQVEAVESAM
jgi:hypothetical protein